MASNAVASGPVISLELEKPRHQNYYKSGDVLKGILSVEIPFDLQHQGIKVTLTGTVINKSQEMYFGGASTGMLQVGA